MYKIIAAVLGISLLIGMAPAWTQKEMGQPLVIPDVFDEERVLPGMTAEWIVLKDRFPEAARELLFRGPKPVNI